MEKLYLCIGDKIGADRITHAGYLSLKCNIFISFLYFYGTKRRMSFQFVCQHRMRLKLGIHLDIFLSVVSLCNLLFATIFYSFFSVSSFDFFFIFLETKSSDKSENFEPKTKSIYIHSIFTKITGQMQKIQGIKSFLAQKKSFLFLSI